MQQELQIVSHPNEYAWHVRWHCSGVWVNLHPRRWPGNKQISLWNSTRNWYF